MNRDELYHTMTGLRRDGFKPYTNPIDVEVAENSECDRCGADMYATGLKNDDGEYYVFAVCCECGEAFEF